MALYGDPLNRPVRGNRTDAPALATDSAHQVLQFISDPACSHTVGYDAGIIERAEIRNSFLSHQQNEGIQTDRRRNLQMSQIDLLRITLAPIILSQQR